MHMVVGHLLLLFVLQHKILKVNEGIYMIWLYGSAIAYLQVKQTYSAVMS